MPLFGQLDTDDHLSRSAQVTELFTDAETFSSAR